MKRIHWIELLQVEGEGLKERNLNTQRNTDPDQLQSMAF